MTDTANHRNQLSYFDFDARKRDALMAGVAIFRNGFRALLKAIQESRRRQAEREIASFIVGRGRQMSDDLERRLNRRLFASDWSPRE
jgi:hypothetical protein